MKRNIKEEIENLLRKWAELTKDEKEEGKTSRKYPVMKFSDKTGTYTVYLKPGEQDLYFVDKGTFETSSPEAIYGAEERTDITEFSVMEQNVIQKELISWVELAKKWKKIKKIVDVESE